MFASDTQWTVVRGNELEGGQSQGLPVWSRHVGDPILAGGSCPGRTGAAAADNTASSVFRARHPHLDPKPLPKFEHHDARREPTLIATARSQMTASSPRGTFSQAELTAELVTRCITLSMPVVPTCPDFRVAPIRRDARS